MLTLNILANVKSREALCSSCVYEVRQMGYNGEKLTFCSYGEMRELKFEVCECSVYADRRIPKREKVIGFVKPGEATRPKITVIKIS